MDAFNPLYWHQGLFLQPQHLQVQAFRMESLGAPVRRYSQQYLWGVAGVNIQDTTLEQKRFEVISGQFIFPSGLHAVVPGNAVVRARSFEDAWGASEEPFTIYLGIKKVNTAGSNVTVVNDLNAAAEVNTRFVTTADPEEVPDLHGQGPAGQVKSLYLMLRLIWERELEELRDYEVMPLARLARYGEEVRLSDRYVPPCPSVGSSEWLLQMVKDVRDQVTSRCRQLEEYKSPKEALDMEYDIGYIIFLMALRSLNRYVPLLNHYLEAPFCHPWQVYGLLRQLAGELSTFSETVSAVGESVEEGSKKIPGYDHQDLYGCFSTIRKTVAELLESIVVGPGHRIRLTYDGVYYSGTVSQAMLSPQNRYWLVLRTEAPSDQVIDAMRHVAKLSSKRNITTLVARAVSGVPLEYYPVPPPGLPRRSHSYYYLIDHDSAEWRDIEASGAVSLYWDTAPDDLAAEIMVLRS